MAAGDRPSPRHRRTPPTGRSAHVRTPGSGGCRAAREHPGAGGNPHRESGAWGGSAPYSGETADLTEPPASLKEGVRAGVAAEPRPRESGAAAERLRTPVAPRTSDALPGVPVMAP